MVLLLVSGATPTSQGGSRWVRLVSSSGQPFLSGSLSVPWFGFQQAHLWHMKAWPSWPELMGPAEHLTSWAYQIPFFWAFSSSCPSICTYFFKLLLLGLIFQAPFHPRLNLFIDFNPFPSLSAFLEDPFSHSLAPLRLGDDEHGFLCWNALLANLALAKSQTQGHFQKPSPPWAFFCFYSKKEPQFFSEGNLFYFILITNTYWPISLWVYGVLRAKSWFAFLHLWHLVVLLSK